MILICSESRVVLVPSLKIRNSTLGRRTRMVSQVFYDVDDVKSLRHLSALGTDIGLGYFPTNYNFCL